MASKPIIPRRAAIEDIDSAIDHYLAEADVEVALAFIDAVEGAYRHIARHPASGSPRYAAELELPGLRCWRLRRFPYLVFYVDCDESIDVWRVLHGERDIPAWMAP